MNQRTMVEAKNNETDKGPQTYRFFPQQRRLDVLGGGGRGFAQDVFKLRCYIEKKV